MNNRITQTSFNDTAALFSMTLLSRALSSASLCLFSAATTVLAISLPTGANPPPLSMTGAEILDAVSGRTTIGTFSDRPVSYAVYLTEEGQMIARISEGVEENIDLGQWRVANDSLCGQWENLGGGEENCFTYYQVGDNIHAYNADGSLNRIQYFVDGDPLGLQQQVSQNDSSASSIEPTNVLVGSMDSDQQAIVGKIEDWREMFSATGRGDRFDIDDYPQLFLPEERQAEMLTYDQYVPNWASTQIDGVEGYRRVWNVDVNESFAGWTIEKLDVLRVEVNGNLAWSAVNYWGTGERPDGSTYEGSQHGTHVWYDIAPGPERDWRIAHEHLTQITVNGEENVRYEGSPLP